MWTGPDIAATIVGGISLLWAIASSFIAGSAQRKATAAGTEAATANKRAAVALEKANELTEKLLAPPPAPWTLTFGQDNIWNLQNDTGNVVGEAFIESIGGEFHEQGSTWSLIQPDALIQLQAVAPFAHATIVVHWTDPSTNNQRKHPITVQSLSA